MTEARRDRNWLRRIEFRDRPDEDGEPPVHICSSGVWINGERASRVRIHRTEAEQDAGIESPVTTTGLRIRQDRPLHVVTNGGLTGSEVLVSFVIHADDVVMPDYDDRETHPMIGPYEALIPPGDDTERRWRRVWADTPTRTEVEVTDEDRVANPDLLSKWQEGPLPAEVEDPESEWVRVWFMAREVLFHSPPPPLTDDEWKAEAAGLAEAT